MYKERVDLVECIVAWIWICFWLALFAVVGLFIWALPELLWGFGLAFGPPTLYWLWRRR